MTNITTITAQHKRMLRGADQITFHMYDGQSMIRGHYRGDGKGVQDSYQQIDTAHRVHNYDRNAAQIDMPVEAYSFYYHAYQQDVLRTLIDRLRTGDTLSLIWTRSNNNENSRRIGWERDELRLQINHANGKAEVYMVAAQTGPNDTARMCRIDPHYNTRRTA